jgi:bifunctional DNA-binding transcriptional regulator/antitoxin component of YhaV-PrlF toxin-antitoxin module
MQLTRNANLPKTKEYIVQLFNCLIMDLVKMSAKGQLVVPQRLRELAGYKEGDRFVAEIVNGNLTFRRVSIEERMAEFEKLTVMMQEHMKKNNLTPADFQEALQWARSKRSSIPTSSSPRSSAKGRLKRSLNCA